MSESRGPGLKRHQSSESLSNSEQSASGACQSSITRKRAQSDGIGKEVIRFPGPYDVLMGRGAQATDYSGNLRFRELVKERKAEYISCKKRKDKSRICGEVVDAVKGRGGRFLQRVEVQRHGSGPDSTVEYRYDIVEDRPTLLVKVKQLMRDAGTGGRAKKGPVQEADQANNETRRSQHETNETNQAASAPQGPASIRHSSNLSGPSSELIHHLHQHRAQIHSQQSYLQMPAQLQLPVGPRDPAPLDALRLQQLRLSQPQHYRTQQQAFNTPVSSGQQQLLWPTIDQRSGLLRDQSSITADEMALLSELARRQGRPYGDGFNFRRPPNG